MLDPIGECIVTVMRPYLRIVGCLVNRVNLKCLLGILGAGYHMMLSTVAVHAEQRAPA